MAEMSFVIKHFIYDINIETGLASVLCYNNDKILFEATIDLKEKGYTDEEIMELEQWLKD